MMTIRYNPEFGEMEEVIGQIESLQLAHGTEIHNSNEPIALLDGDAKVVGIRPILSYLETLSSELSSWYYCGC